MHSSAPADIKPWPQEREMKPSLYPAETQELHTVCVTGATGYVGSNLVARLLAAGHTVHGTVRDLSLAPDLKALSGAEERLKLFQADLLEPEGLKTAMQGCAFVFHVASPYNMNVGYGEVARKRLVEPALQGTENVLSAVNATPSVRRVVLTSSVAAIAHSYLEKEIGYMHTEDDWNTVSTLHNMPYSYSKTLAEKKAWEMAGQQTRWDLVVINPSVIWGPPLINRGDGTSINIMRSTFKGDYSPVCPVMGMGWVDVRDVAAAHMLAAFTPAAKGRHIVSACNRLVKDVVEIVADLYPKHVAKPRWIMPKWLIVLVCPLMGMGRDVMRAHVGGTVYYSNEKSSRELGVTYIPLEETIKDMCEECDKRGMIKIRK